MISSQTLSPSSRNKQTQRKQTRRHKSEPRWRRKRGLQAEASSPGTLFRPSARASERAFASAGARREARSERDSHLECLCGANEGAVCAHSPSCAASKGGGACSTEVGLAWSGGRVRGGVEQQSDRQADAETESGVGLPGGAERSSVGLRRAARSADSRRQTRRSLPSRVFAREADASADAPARLLAFCRPGPARAACSSSARLPHLGAPLLSNLQSGSSRPFNQRLLPSLGYGRPRALLTKADVNIYCRLCGGLLLSTSHQPSNTSF